MESITLSDQKVNVAEPVSSLIFIFFLRIKRPLVCDVVIIGNHSATTIPSTSKLIKKNKRRIKYGYSRTLSI